MVENEVRDALSNRIYRVLSGDAFEIANTQTALDNALAGKPIPRIPGRKGGSAYSRLVKVFGEHITEGLSKREALDKLILRSAKAPRGVGKGQYFLKPGFSIILHSQDYMSLITIRDSFLKTRSHMRKGNSIVRRGTPFSAWKKTLERLRERDRLKAPDGSPRKSLLLNLGLLSR